jgi:glycerol kinase
MSVLAIDAGTTGITTLVVSSSGATLARGYQEFEQHFPNPGWVEHDPEQIWQATLASVRQALENLASSAYASDVPECIGVTNQRETLVLWDRQTLRAPTNAIVWQDRRTSELLNDQKFVDAATEVRKRTGLPLDPYFTSSKLLWVKRNLPDVWRGVAAGVTAVGTVESYLVARMSGARTHITDATNASRTQLYNIHTGDWDDWLLELFEVPRSALPSITANYGALATTFAPAFLDLELPITGLAGDQQAALFGQAATSAGTAKCTYGTGAFLLMHTGGTVVDNDDGMLATVALQHANGSRDFALEGSVFVAGAAVQWLRDGLQIIESASEVEALASQVPDAGGVSFVPAFTGLGAPFWNPNARGAIVGITRGTTKAHIARATLEAIVFQVKAVFDAMTGGENATPLKKLRVDGGASVNNLLMQIQADQLGVDIERPESLETTALGVAYLAGLGAGIWQSADDVSQLNKVRTRFTPEATDSSGYLAWMQAVKQIAGRA